MTVRAPVRVTRGGLLGALLAALLVLTACGGGGTTAAPAAPPAPAPAPGGAAPAPAPAPSRTLTVVASTNVWGSVASAIAGPGIEVRSIITDPASDPHSYEATPADAAALTQADLIVWNGGGYDEWVEQILETDPAAQGKAIEAFTLRGDQADENEHVWFDPAAARGVIAQVTERLAALEPTQADALRQRAAAFTAQVDQYAAGLATIGQARPDARVAATEPIAQYLFTTAGITDATPEEFLEAIEEENSPPVASVAATQQLVGARQVGALVFNPQTETPVTQDLRQTAQQSGVPVVQVTETLPAGMDYMQWLAANRIELARALGVPA